MSWMVENVVLVAYPDDDHEPVVDIYGGEVIYDPDTGAFEGYERGEWWESLVLDAADGAPATLDDMDTVLAKHGYTRTDPWHGPKVTRRGERYIANAEIDFGSIR
jgi:hypothetical protein